MAPHPWESMGDVNAPVDVEILREELIAGVRLQRLRFLSHLIDGEPLWVYGLLSRPEICPAPVPGLVHIHGGTQSACIEHALFFAGRGYAVLSFDWTGPTTTRSGKFTTVFPASIPVIHERKGNPERARIRHVVWMARRGLTLLANRPEVDGEKLGVFGISWGGLATWLVNGTDRRVRAAVPIFGCGIHESPSEEAAWCEAYQPAHYAASQSGPVFYLNGTNDFFGHLDTLESFWDAITVDKRISLSPNEDHGIEESVKVAGRRWFDYHLKGVAPHLPAQPRVEIEVQDGGLWAEVHAPEARQIRLFYAVTGDGTRPIDYWYLGPWGRINQGFFSSRWMLPIGSRRLAVYAEATYEDGATQCSMITDCFERIGTVALDAVDGSIWYDPLMSKSPWYTRWDVRGAGLCPGRGVFRVGKSRADGRLCLLQAFANRENRFEAILRRPSCPVVGRGQGVTLAIDCFCAAGGTLRLTASAAHGHTSFDHAILGTLVIAVHPQAQWQTVNVDVELWREFNFNQVRQMKFILQADGPPLVEIGRVRVI